MRPLETANDIETREDKRVMIDVGATARNAASIDWPMDV
jgi:hypothetical protein